MNFVHQYARVHQNRTNIIIHVLTVPVFVVSIIGLIISFLLSNYLLTAIFFICPFIVMVIQGVGHKLEVNRPEPFTGPANIVSRIFSEQFYKFWVFLIFRVLGKV